MTKISNTKHILDLEIQFLRYSHGRVQTEYTIHLGSLSAQANDSEDVSAHG